MRTTVLLNCLVSGGRAHNELPSDYKINHVLDVDLRSCYGTALRSFQYPVGLPTTVAFGPNEKRLTLKEFLEAYRDELIPGLYKITVSGKLSFEQDLLFSKVTSYDKMAETPLNFSKKFESFGDEVVHFTNDFVLARQECLNSVMTSDILDVLKKVARSNEYKELMELEVQTALLWKRSDQCRNPREWVERVLENPGELVFNEENQGVCDTRSRLWFSIPLEGFIGKLVDRRNRIKGEAKSASTESERLRLKGLQNILKLFINTLYGCFASPYFSIGNVVLVDCITARACVNVWKGLNLRQSIRDGGLYTPVGVNFFRDLKLLRKPGFHILSDIRRLNTARVYKSLEGMKWLQLFKIELYSNRQKEQIHKK